MKKISEYWELHDFCLTHGRIVPHLQGNSPVFTRFHCEDKRHDPCDTIICSEGIGTCQATMAGILSMQGYVVEFVGEDKMLFCTLSELEVLKKESKELEQEERKAKEDTSVKENPARPRGLKITRADMVITYKAYEKCLEYPEKMHRARALGYLTPPYLFGDSSYTNMLCKDDCIFCHCPFYARNLLDELRHNHREDYDEWVLDYFKNFKWNKLSFMEREYLIMDIVDGQDSKYGKILIVKANPVTTNSLGLRYASDIRGTHTELFHLPLSKRYIDPLVQIAQNQQIWSPNENDYKDERVRDERNNRILTVHRHKDLINAFQLSKPKMKYYVKEITFNNSDFSKLEETWDFSENGIDTPHGSISFNSFMEVSQSGMNGLQFDTDGILYFDDIDNCPLEDAYISTVAVMRQPFNAWLWLYLINEDGVTIASICGHDDLDGFSKYVANLRKAYQ